MSAAALRDVSTIVAGSTLVASSGYLGVVVGTKGVASFVTLDADAPNVRVRMVPLRDAAGCVDTDPALASRLARLVGLDLAKVMAARSFGNPCLTATERHMVAWLQALTGAAA